MTRKKINSTRHKTIAVIAMLLLLFLVYLFPFHSSLKIKVFNTTEYDIDSLNIDNKFFSIKKGQSLLISNCKSISMQGPAPFGFPNARIKGKKRNPHDFTLCGTGVEKVKSGNYQFDITAIEDSNFFSLYWELHK